MYRDRRDVEQEEAQNYASENNIIWMETSAKKPLNIPELFVNIAEKLPKNPPQPERDAFPIIPPKAQSNGCC